MNDESNDLNQMTEGLLKSLDAEKPVEFSTEQVGLIRQAVREYSQKPSTAQPQITKPSKRGVDIHGIIPLVFIRLYFALSIGVDVRERESSIGLDRRSRVSSFLKQTLFLCFCAMSVALLIYQFYSVVSFISPNVEGPL